MPRSAWDLAHSISQAGAILARKSKLHCTMIIMRLTSSWSGILLIAGLLLIPTGCDSFLEPDPASFSTTANFYESEAQVETAVNGAYARLRQAFGDDDYRNMTDLRGPNITRHFDVNLPHTVAGIPQLDEFTMTLNNGVVTRTWQRLYTLIKETNVVLSRLEGVEFTDNSLKERYTAELLTMRALAYWAAVQFWGDVPLIIEEIRTPSDVEEPGRQPASSVYSQVITDLQAAIGALPASYSGGDVGRITSGAAQFLLGKTYLLTGEYQSALTQFESLDTSGPYMLLADYRSVFDPGNKNNAESILELQYDPNITGQGDIDNLIEDIVPFNSGTDLIPAIGVGNPRGVYLPTPDVTGSYEEGDLRLEASIDWYVKAGNADFVELSQGDALPIFRKFYFPEFISDQGYDANWIVFRFSDVLLSAAEAQWRLGNDGAAMGYLDRVRARAGLPPVSLANFPGDVTGSSMGDAILNERKIELLGEGHYWLDLLRFGTDVAMGVMEDHGDLFRARDPKTADVYVIQSFKLLYPIPVRDTDLAGLSQNPGWQ